MSKKSTTGTAPLGGSTLKLTVLRKALEDCIEQIEIMRGYLKKYKAPDTSHAVEQAGPVAERARAALAFRGVAR